MPPDRSHGRASDSFSRVAVFAIVALIIFGCATAASLVPIRFKTDFSPGTHLLGQVTSVGSRHEIVGNRNLYSQLLAAGLADADITDGRIVLARINCCGGPDEDSNSRIVYVPRDLETTAGDIVEIRLGSQGGPSSRAEMHQVVRIREKARQQYASCRWVPDCSSCWNRVIYCDGLEAEGWVRKGGMDWWVLFPEDAENSTTRPSGQAPSAPRASRY